MANGFKTTTSKYISKSGNDSGTGSADDPYKSISSAVSSGDSPPYTTIGAGIYSYSAISGRRHQLVGDGKVIIDFNDTTVFTSNIDDSTKPLLENLECKNIGILYGRSTTNPIIGACILKGIKALSARPFDFINCIILDSTFINNSTESRLGSDSYNFCIIVNSTIKFSSDAKGASVIKNCYIGFNSSIAWTSSAVFSTTTFSNNNIQGIIELSISSVVHKYAIQDELTGTPQDNGYAVGVKWLTEAQLTTDGYSGTFTDLDDAVATCINKDPLFNNVGLSDFSLQADSPHIGAASDGTNIGNTTISNTILVNQDGVGTIDIDTSAEIDTSNPIYYIVDLVEDEGYIDIIQRLGTQPIVITKIEPITNLEFDSDITGGSVGNRNVPDSEPQTADYPRKVTTTSLASNDTTLNVTGHTVLMGEYVRVAGEDREVTSVATDVITVASSFRAIVGNDITFQVGTEAQLAALKPNRLTYQLRVSTQVDKPAIDEEWDNNIDPIHGFAGLFSTQEWYKKPGYVIDGMDVFGSGDSEANPAITPDEIACTWYNIRVWLRNNYES